LSFPYEGKLGVIKVYVFCIDSPEWKRICHKTGLIYLCGEGVKMHTKQIGKNLYLIDLQTGGFRNLIASYVLKGEKTIIVETGPTSSIPNLLSGIKELNIDPQNVAYVALTHIHVDHGGGVGTLLRTLPNAKVIVHQKGAAHLKDPAKLWAASKQTLGFVAEMFGEPEPVPEERIIVASEGMNFDAGEGMKLRALETSGHASHNLSFYENQNMGVFPGDAAGAYFAEVDTVYPTTPPPFRPDIALISLDKLINLNPAFLYYSHFGEASDAVKRLRSYQMQIKHWLQIVEEGLKLGETAEAIRERIFSEDETIQKVVPSLKSNPVHKKTLIENSVQGFIEFAKNPQI
jgi:glyoxylase-like metal-dependent hydrolase (beta-lactamase superfamily II)